MTGSGPIFSPFTMMFAAFGASSNQGFGMKQRGGEHNQVQYYDDWVLQEAHKTGPRLPGRA